MSTKLAEKDVKGLTRSEAEDKLFDAGYRPSESKKFLKEHKDVLATGAKSGIFQDVLNFLGTKARTQKEFLAFVSANTTLNEKRWFNNRDQIRVVLNKVHAEKDFKEVLDAAGIEAMALEVKTIAETAAKAKKAEAEKAKK